MRLPDQRASPSPDVEDAGARAGSTDHHLVGERTAGDGSPPASGASARAALAVAVLGFFIVTLDAVVVNVALPSIRASLGGGTSGLQWVVDGYTLMFAGLLLAAGSLTDRIGARGAFAGGLALFALASVWCGLAHDLATLVVARFGQGAGAAILMPASMALVRHAYPEPVRRGRALAMWAMGGAVASSCGPVLGGLLSEASWRLIFLLNVPFSAVAVAILTRIPSSPRHRTGFDPLGQTTALLAMTGLVFGLIEGGARGFSRPYVVASLALAGVALAAFLAAQARVAHPMMPLPMFRSRGFSVSLVVGFAFMIGYYGTPFLLSLYLQDQRGMSAVTTGATFLPMMLAGAALTPFTGHLVERTGPRAPIIAGLALMAVGVLALAATPADTAAPVLALLLVLVGVAGPLVAPPVTTVLLSSVPAHRSGVASGVFNTARQLGGALAIAVFGTLVSSAGEFLRGQRISLVVTAVFALAAAAAAASLTGDRPRRTPQTAA